MKLQNLLLVFMALVISSCLKTRSEVAEQDLSRVYGRKNANNQAAQASPSQLAVPPAPAAVDDRDETIRALNGRIESLENQISTINKEKSEQANSPESQKLQLMQDALAKMEAQIQRLEAEAAAASATPVASAPVPSTSSPAVTAGSAKADKKETQNSYEIAQEHFGKKEWKKAILSYQKYVDENSKGKNIADAKYKIGVCFQELNMKEEAMAFYEEVIANYGKLEAGKKAKLRLAKLKK